MLASRAAGAACCSALVFPRRARPKFLPGLAGGRLLPCLFTAGLEKREAAPEGSELPEPAHFSLRVSDLLLKNTRAAGARGFVMVLSSALGFSGDIGEAGGGGCSVPCERGQLLAFESAGFIFNRG